MVAHPMLLVWKSGSRSPKSWSWRLLPCPQWTQRVHILGANPFCIPLTKSVVLTTTLIFWQVKDRFWAVLRPLLSSQSLIFTHPAFEVQPWGKPQNISERSGWSGGVICRYFSSRNRCENKIFCENKHCCCVVYFSHSFWMTLYILV